MASSQHHESATPSKFGIELSVDEVEGLNAPALKERILTASEELYDEKESVDLRLGADYTASSQGGRASVGADASSGRAR